MRLLSSACHQGTGRHLASGAFFAVALAACQSPAGVESSFAAGDRSADCRDSDPVEKAEDFYQKIISARVRGLPSPEAMSDFAPLLSQAMQQAIEQARTRQQARIAAHPDEKPEFIEGDLFTSLFEGPTGVESARVKKAGDLVAVEVSFVHGTRDNQPSRWKDVALLRCEQGDWRVDDVHFGGSWDFAPKGSLRSALVAAN